MLDQSPADGRVAQLMNQNRNRAASSQRLFTIILVGGML